MGNSSAYNLIQVVLTTGRTEESFYTEPLRCRARQK